MSEAAKADEAPKITLVTKEKNPNRVANAKKLAGIRAEKRLQDLKMNALKNRVEAYENVEEREGGQIDVSTVNYFIAAVGFAASAIAIYQFMNGASTDRRAPSTVHLGSPKRPHSGSPKRPQSADFRNAPVSVTDHPGDIITFD